MWTTGFAKELRGFWEITCWPPSQIESLAPMENRFVSVSYKLRVSTPSSFSLSARLVPRTMLPPLYIAATVPIAFILLLLNVWWNRHWKLRNLPTPVCFLFIRPLLPRLSDPHSQAGASLVWGPEKHAFEDCLGFQWRAWFNECGRAFKIKAAWGHPEIVRKRLPSSNCPDVY